jgi:LysM repeat protein
MTYGGNLSDQTRKSTPTQTRVNVSTSSAYAEWKKKQEQAAQQQAAAYRANQVALAQARKKRIEQENAARMAQLQKQQAAYQQNEAYKAKQLQQVYQKQMKVKAGDTAESLAKKAGTTADVVAGSVSGSLRPGQVINVPTTYDDGNELDRLMRSQALSTGQAGRVTGNELDLDEINKYMGPVYQGLGMGIPGLGNQMQQWGTRLLPTISKALGRLAIRAGQGTESPWFNPEQERFTQMGEELVGQGDMWQGSPEWYKAIGEDMPRADLEQYNVDRRIPGGIHDQIAAAEAEAQQQRSLFATTMRYTGQALMYAWDRMVSGDPDWQRYISNSDGEVVMTLTDGRWEHPMKEQFNDEQWEKILSLGFVETSPGFWEVPTLVEPDFGMGGFSFPGFDSGGFGGFGGGDYEYLSRGGQQRKKAGGGASTGDTYRVFAEGVPSPHWRI